MNRRDRKDGVSLNSISNFVSRVIGESDNRDLFAETRLNHQTAITGSVLAQECGDMLRAFFAERRASQKAARLATTDTDKPTA